MTQENHPHNIYATHLMRLRKAPSRTKQLHALATTSNVTAAFDTFPKTNNDKHTRPLIWDYHHHHWLARLPTLQAKLVAGSVPFTVTKHRQQGVHNTHYYHNVQIENRQVMRTHNHKSPLSTRIRQISTILNHDHLMARLKTRQPNKIIIHNVLQQIIRNDADRSRHYKTIWPRHRQRQYITCGYSNLKDDAVATFNQRPLHYVFLST